MIRHVAGIAEIVDDVEAAVRFYQDVLGLEVQHEPGDPYATVSAPGVLHFGLWSRRAAAESVFGDGGEAARIPLGFTVGFEVDAVDTAQATLESRGLRILQARRAESWGQVTSRFLLPSGALSEISETPWARKILEPARVEAPAP
jgi:catechol 2,3-dioxygenase-like lactoylglutathione lyase family enzyme